MKKIIFYLSVVMTLYLLIKTISVLSSEFNRLSHFGFGYLSGNVILFIIFAALCYFTFRSLKIKR